MRRAVRITRHAISPRLAIRIFLNICALSPSPHLAQLLGPFARQPGQTEVPQHWLNRATTTPIAFQRAMQITELDPSTLAFSESVSVTWPVITLYRRVIAISSIPFRSISERPAKLQVQRGVR